jgi:hypothetical protein
MDIGWQTERNTNNHTSNDTGIERDRHVDAAGIDIASSHLALSRAS